MSSCISSASPEDTINISAGGGTASWGSVTINKGVKIMGPGASNLAVSGTITYNPSDMSANHAFRFSGFKVNCASGRCFVFGDSERNTYAQNKIRVDHNVFENCGNPALRTDGPFFGVFDHNTLSGNPHFDMYWTNNAACSDWTIALQQPATHGQIFGSSLNFYIEDNVFNTGTVASTAGGHGGRSVWRYNTFNWTDSESHPMPWFDAHGNQTNVPVGNQLVEIYGNRISGPMNSSSFEAFDMRGGMYRIFWNLSVGHSISATNREDSYGCDYDSVFCPQYEQRLHNSYNWNNRRDSGAAAVWNESDGCDDIAANQQYWNFNTSFNGSSGTGCGTLAQMNAISNCTPGTGFFATNLSCNSVSENSAGANPSQPITGTLYKCNSSRQWVADYTPYTYPHPLTSENENCANCCTITQTCPTNLTTVGSCTRCCATACQTVSTCTDNDGDRHIVENNPNFIACGNVCGIADNQSCIGYSDCNDNNPSIYYGAPEICGNNIDEDCSGADQACPAPTCASQGGTCCAAGQACTPSLSYNAGSLKIASADKGSPKTSFIGTIKKIAINVRDSVSVFFEKVVARFSGKNRTRQFAAVIRPEAGAQTATTYYLTSSGSGTHSGSSYANSMSLAEHNSRTFLPGDTIFICGKVTGGELTPPSSGTATAYINYRGDCPGYAGSLEQTFSYPNLTQMMFIQNRRYLNIQKLSFDANETDDDSGSFSAIWIEELDQPTGNIKISDCRFEETVTGIYIRGDARHVDVSKSEFNRMVQSGVSVGTYYGRASAGMPSFITVGGSRENGNMFANIGREDNPSPGSVPGQVFGTQANDSIFSYNHVYADEPGWGTGIYLNGVSKILIEYNYIHDLDAVHRRSPIALKSDFSWKNSDIIIRFNKIGPTHGGTGLYTDPDGGIRFNNCLDNFMIYGNLIKDVSDMGLFTTWGWETDYSSDGCIPEDVFVYSNIIARPKTASGLYMAGTSGTDHFKNFHFTNNLIYRAADDSITDHSSSYGIHLRGSDNNYQGVYFKNNIIDTPRDLSADHIGIYALTQSDIQYDYNHHYFPGATPQVYYENSDCMPCAWNSTSRPNNYGAHDSTGDPIYLNPSENNYGLRVGSPCIDSGEILNVTLPSFQIQGKTYYFDLADGLDPAVTDWNQTIPVVNTIKQTNQGSGWEKGPYVYKTSVSLCNNNGICDSEETNANCPGDCQLNPPTCASSGYSCCASCASGPHTDLNSTCSQGVCCESCAPASTPPASDCAVCCVNGFCVDAPAVSTCSDGTSAGTCSDIAPWYCTPGLSLVQDCARCGCRNDWECNLSTGICSPPSICGDGICVNDTFENCQKCSVDCGTCLTAGRHNITLTVKDSLGNVASDSISLNVNP